MEPGKLAVLLEREGIMVSGSTVGRVMARLRTRGLLVEPENVRLAKLARKRRRRQRYAVRRPKDYKVEAPGDLVQVDTLHARLVPDGAPTAVAEFNDGNGGKISVYNFSIAKWKT